MLVILLLLMVLVLLPIMWVWDALPTFDTVAVIVRGIRLGWLLVVRKLSEVKPPWANRSLLNYVRILVARYSPLNGKSYNSHDSWMANSSVVTYAVTG